GTRSISTSDDSPCGRMTAPAPYVAAARCIPSDRPRGPPVASAAFPYVRAQNPAIPGCLPSPAAGTYTVARSWRSASVSAAPTEGVWMVRLGAPRGFLDALLLARRRRYPDAPRRAVRARRVPVPRRREPL